LCAVQSPTFEVFMRHDLNGRVGPPRCQECNAPLDSDEHSQDLTDLGFFCLECQLAFEPLAERSLSI
jgi:hypothetical protein